MSHATAKSVLGNFDNATFDYFGARSRFFKRDGKFFIETDGPGGTLGVFEIKYTFGVDPLQQYLVEFPDGRLQALPIAWDTRPTISGGQRWFHLYLDEPIRHDDILHWTKLYQNWNFMCAECHSTGIHKNYDAAADRFNTTWAEISVGCEACHGQGSKHVAWARAHDDQAAASQSNDLTKGLLVQFDERKNIVWSHDQRTNEPVRSSPPATLRKEVETCGLCHARRVQFSERWVPGRWLSDTHFISPLARGLYEADGQMLDEVYNYGSFKQSRMFAAGVTCSDCHDPHSGKLRASDDGVCLQCHVSEKYAVVTHSRHANVGPPLTCVSCHMLAQTYMRIDARHDHSFRVPRPDLTVRFSAPNTCNSCHRDKRAEWAAGAIEHWYGPKRIGFQNYAEAFSAAWSGRGDGTTLLTALASDTGAPAFARAGAFAELASRQTLPNVPLAKTGLSDPDPMVRIAALETLQNLPPREIWSLAAPLLSDPVRGVRIKAASRLAAVPTADRSTADRDPFTRAADEFIAAQRLNADRPEARSELGSFLARTGHPVDAEAEYKAALQLDRQYVPAAINLADLYRMLGRDADGEHVLRTMASAMPRNAEVHYALGLALVRLKRSNDALAEFQRAAEGAPDRARYAYVFAVALHSLGRTSDAMTVLRNNLSRHPDDLDTLLGLITFNRDAGELSTALEYAEQLAKRAPSYPGIDSLIQELRRIIAK